VEILKTRDGEWNLCFCNLFILLCLIIHIKIYRILNLPVLCMGVKLGR
jgi:hypothetical protein